jgi:TonB family protein
VGEKTQDLNKLLTVDASLIPDIKIIGNKTVVKKSENQKQEYKKEQETSGATDSSKLMQADDTADSEMLVIYDYIKRKIQENKKYPWQAKKENIEGIVEMQFSISGNGQLKDVNIIKSSGYSILDEEAVATIKRSAPYPEIKNRLNTDNLQLQVKLIYKIE